ncbi:nucleotide sugar dehydrogenase [Histidinibacterium lentulum]|uniref:UDP-glucose 6-dehydrogenase n=1 Tax=Histidinibacterium lentulum TaxID=2480588 RepID=A0A3N2R8F9_9RHOB|nr:UDP-glucose/GDP-mannose dehydrogenase family protein [Histidinibacterium lentulum]ROU03616.1 UDP-glucose/GDP-mannose dehydrogenase family protein [Histidinibacterium lentulum]
MAKISVFGIGYVGIVSAACLARDGHEVVAVDLDPAKVGMVNGGRSPIVERGLDALLAEVVGEGRLRATTDAGEAMAATDASFVCVGTPSAPDGSVGLDYVEAVCRTIGEGIAGKESFHSVVIRSTIVPGTMARVCIPALESTSGRTAGEGFGVGYFPEFLRESTAIEDYYAPGLIVFGALDQGTADFLGEINAHLPCVSHAVDLSTAEMVKYTSNAWRAMKVSFANEIGNVAKASGLDGQLVMRLLCSDTKVAMSPHFLRPGFAFGGSCLPKDVRALRALAGRTGVETPLLDAVLEANAAQIRRAEEMVRASGDGPVGIVGISFKAGTDDLRESPLASLAARLIEAGKDVRIYDPFVSQAFRESEAAAGRGDGVVPDLSARMLGSIDELIDSSEVILVGNSYDEAREPLLKARDSKPMVDLTRLDREVVSTGPYQGICW